MNPELKQTYKRAGEFLQAHDDFLLLCHEKPDGDALGSVLGAAHVLQSLGKTFTLVNDDPIANRFDFLPLADSFRVTDEVERTFQAVIAFDCGDRKRIGGAERLIAPDAVLLNIDHHKTNDYFGSENLVDLQAAATCQIVYKIVQEMGLPLTLDAATCLYTGLVTDTGGFRYSNTSEEVLLIAAALLKQGVQPYNVVDKVMETMSWPQLLLIREGLQQLERDASGRIAWIVVTRELLARAGACEEDVEGLVNYPRNVEGVEVGISFRESSPDQVKVSMRSKYVIDVGAIAQEFGGGGHARAAGCTMAGTLADVSTRVIARIQQAFDEVTAR